MSYSSEELLVFVDKTMAKVHNTWALAYKMEQLIVQAKNDAYEAEVNLNDFREKILSELDKDKKFDEAVHPDHPEIEALIAEEEEIQFKNRSLASLLDATGPDGATTAEQAHTPVEDVLVAYEELAEAVNEDDKPEEDVVDADDWNIPADAIAVDTSQEDWSPGKQGHNIFVPPEVPADWNPDEMAGMDELEDTIGDLVDKVKANPAAEPPKLIPVKDLTENLVESGFTNEMGEIHDAVAVLSGGLGTYATVLENQVTQGADETMSVSFVVSNNMPTKRFPNITNFILAFTCKDGEVTDIRLTEYKDDEIIHHVVVNAESLALKELPANFMITPGVSKTFMFLSEVISEILPTDVVNDELKEDGELVPPLAKLK